MGARKKCTKYLLLDVNDVTNICGSLTVDELLKMLSIPNRDLELWLCKYGILENKYYVVEDI